jgi:predicted ATPase
VWVVSHSAALVAALQKQAGCTSIVLKKELGETTVEGIDLLDRPAWTWPPR